MKIFMAHNYYRSDNPSGEEASFEAEAAMLRGNGHNLVVYKRQNDEISDYPVYKKLSLLWKTSWAGDSAKELRKLFREDRPDVAHFQNTFPLISPSAYHVCREFGIPVVQSLRNYRLICPKATFYRDGSVCEDCMEAGSPWLGVKRGCYRKSIVQSSAVALMIALHGRLGTWERKVDLYITPSEFTKEKYVRWGLSPDRIFVKPNFVHPDPGMRKEQGRYALFVGRISEEKGLHVLLNAWEGLDGIPLKIVGSGPIVQELQNIKQSRNMANVEFLGRLGRADTISTIKGARLVVFPSQWYETFGRVAAEAFACGVPVIATRIGAAAEIVEDGRTGMLFELGNPVDLSEKVVRMWSDSKRTDAMGKEARRVYEAKYTAEQNYRMLISIYEEAIRRAASVQ